MVNSPQLLLLDEILRQFLLRQFDLPQATNSLLLSKRNLKIWEKEVSKVPAVGVDELEDKIGMIQDSANHDSYVSAMKNGWRIAKEEGFHRTRLLGIHLRK
jgi:hypothetical protein